MLHALPEDTPYNKGCYHGKVIFPAQYPHAPPAILMMTPSGRLETGKRLCLSMTDFHPESWNPAWSVETILVGLLSFSSQMRKATDLSEALKSNVSFWPRRVGKQTRSLRFSNLFFLIFSVRRRLLQRTCQLCHMSHQTPRKDSKKDWPWRRWRHARNAPAVNSNAGFVVTSPMSL